MKTALLAASLVLIAGSAAACGGGSGGDAPSDASQGDFCTQFAKVTTVKDGKSASDWVDAMKKVGTPKDLSDDERTGFEVFMDAADEIDTSATAEQLQSLDSKLSKDDEKKFTAFFTYATTNCAEQLQAALPTDLPSE